MKKLPIQNIPVRTDIGRALRTAFVPKPNSVLVNANYDALEIRIMAQIINRAKKSWPAVHIRRYEQY